MPKDPKRVTAGRRSKAKGKKWEKVLRDALRLIFGDHIYNADQSWIGGADAEEGADVDGTPFWFEAKHEKSPSVWAALRQAETMQATKGDRRPPVVIAKSDRKPPGWKVGRPGLPVLAVMRATDFFDLLTDYHRLRVGAGEDDLPIERTDPKDWGLR